MGKRILTFITAAILAVSVLTGVALVQTSTAQNGNNGTLKVHEEGTPSGTESNDPKVCNFNFEGFGFDPGQDGYIQIATQGGGPNSTVIETLSFGPTNANGYAETTYLTLDNGLYKATLYGKDTGGNIDLSDVKAKSKNFKVVCEGGQEPEDLVASASVTVTLADCENPGRLTYNANSWVNAFLVGGSTQSGTEGPADYEVVAQADANASFTTGSGTISADKKTQTFSGTLEAQQTGDDCVLGENPEEPETPVTPTTPETPETPSSPEVLPNTSGASPAAAILAVISAVIGAAAVGMQLIRTALSRGL